MTQRFILLLLGIALQSFLFSAQVSAVSPRLKALMQKMTLIDSHADTTQLILAEGYDLGQRHNYGHVDIPRMKEAGMTAQFFSLNPDSYVLTPLQSIKRALQELDAVVQEVRRHPDTVFMAKSTEDILKARGQKKIAVLLGIEGGHVIDSDLRVLRQFHELGVRYMTLTHFNNTDWADSSTAPPRWNGLNDLGRQIVAEMNRLGMMVDISHVSDKTFYDTLQVSRAPLIASHSSCRALCDHPRNMSDEMLRALAKNGGAVQINFFAGYLDKSFFDERERTKAPWEARLAELKQKYVKDPKKLSEETRKIQDANKAELPKVSLSRCLDHFMHAIEVAGIDHVGLGSDFDGVSNLLPDGLEDISKLPDLLQGLMDRGLSDSDLLKIAGGNFMRVMREVEKVAGP